LLKISKSAAIGSKHIYHGRLYQNDTFLPFDVKVLKDLGSLKRNKIKETITLHKTLRKSDQILLQAILSTLSVSWSTVPLVWNVSYLLTTNELSWSSRNGCAFF